MFNSKIFDAIVIGGGNAGLESASFISKNNFKVLMITNNIDNIGFLSCNPSIGGVCKGCLIKELSCLGGIMGYVSDLSFIQSKILNKSKGQSCWSTRSQIDRFNYKKYIFKFIINKKNLFIKQEIVKNLLIKNFRVFGVKTNLRNKYFSKLVIITTGTFLNGIIYIGFKKLNFGRINELSNNYLSNQIKEFNNSWGRLKTGTPPRLDSKNIIYDFLKNQNGDYNNISYFSFKNIYKKNKNQFKCWITESNNKTHNIIKKNLKLSPIYNNLLNGVGPRYCPSLEDKIYKFYKNQKHKVFLEPEGKAVKEIYPSGLSMCFPYEIQNKIINSIKGLEFTNILRPGYVVEYDFFNPKFLNFTLESKILKGLFFAGQINGTTGYEEASSQGIIAGINSVLYLKNNKLWIPNKNNSYIGTMINDIISNGINEPYRVFNKSKSSVFLRENNSYLRLFKILKKLNLKNICFNFFNKKYFLLKKLIKSNYFLRNENFFYFYNIFNKIFLIYKYKNYINHFILKKKKFFNLKNIIIGYKFNYFKLCGLSNELSEKLNILKPRNIFDLKKILNINEFNYVFKLLNKFLI